MKTVIESAIKELTNKSETATQALYALQYSQAALNLAHTLSTLSSIPKP